VWEIPHLCLQDTARNALNKHSWLKTFIRFLHLSTSKGETKFCESTHTACWSSLLLSFWTITHVVHIAKRVSFRCTVFNTSVARLNDTLAPSIYKSTSGCAPFHTLWRDSKSCCMYTSLYVFLSCSWLLTNIITSQNYHRWPCLLSDGIYFWYPWHYAHELRARRGLVRAPWEHFNILYVELLVSSWRLGWPAPAVCISKYG
jgi:hypothetical protein